MKSFFGSRNHLDIIMLTGFFLAGILLSGNAQSKTPTDDYPPIYHPELTIRKATGAIKVDGFIEDAGWKDAARINKFFEHNPGDQTRPEVDTEVLVTYDETNFYVAWICYDDPDQVRAFMCERDNIFEGDYVILAIDTYGEASLAYEIAANPYGIPGDLLYSSNYGEDISYDMIFQSEGRITDFGWVVEMAIPFESMRFPDKEEQIWKIDFWRNRPRGSRFQYSIAAYDRDEACWPCQWGTMKGISGIKPGKGLELLPSIVAYQSGSYDDKTGKLDNIDPDGDIALGISYDISSELTAEVTLNPDFSQIESDAAQIDVNSTFALSYAERRPFFQEGSDLFKTYFSAVYTRSINDPLLAGKITWREGSNSVAVLSAHDEHSIIMIPSEEYSRDVENGKSYSNIIRAKHDFGEQCHLGIVATDRRFEGGGSGSLAGLDAKVRFLGSNSIAIQGLVSRTEEVDNPDLVKKWVDSLGVYVTDTEYNESTFDGGKYTRGLDGETFWGNALFTNIARETSKYWTGASYVERNKTFRADNGFEPRNNRRQAEVWLGGVKRFDESKILENINGTVSLDRVWNMDGVRKDEWADFNGEIHFRAAQTGIHSRYMRSNELYNGIEYDDIWNAHTCFNTHPTAALEFGGNVDYGHRIARRDDTMGKELNWGFWSEIQPIDRLYLFGQFSYSQSDNLYNDERLFDQRIFRSRVTFQFSREFSARLISQYNSRYDCWDFDPLLVYRLNSFSVFYLGSSYNYSYMTLEKGEGSEVEEWRLANRQFFLKFQYLFQI
ncbi:MAG: carbohydrate binding family 9 domain-containing protein [Candidatus Krumholzibacteriota bacterium]|nr:carbohydrate binding family 9 domain-containing protein [Candidatus Krumholzibacteriota bacterium]